MTDEPYRYVEAMANRRDYVETQLASASPVIALNYDGGILFLTVAPEPQKVFEIYDRIALGAMGHPGDVERLRMTAIEIASAEGFTRSPADVSLRRLANFSFSPLLKNTYEQVYGPVFLVRLLFAELGSSPATDLFVKMDFDGTILTSGAGRKPFGLLAGTQAAERSMGEYLVAKMVSALTLEEAFQIALQTWAVGSQPEIGETLPVEEILTQSLREALTTKVVEAAILERGLAAKPCYRVLSEAELRKLIPRNLRTN